MSKNSKFNLSNAYYHFVRNITRGRFYLKDFEKMGAKVVRIPHKVKAGVFSRYQPIRIYIDDKEYYVVGHSSPILSSYIHHVNNGKYKTQGEQLAISKELLDFYREKFDANENGIKTEIRRRNLYVITAQLVMLVAPIMFLLEICKYLSTHLWNHGVAAGIAFLIFLISVIMIRMIVKDT